MDIYTLFGMYNEPYVLKAGEFGHEIIGVYTSLNEAREIASQPKYTDDYSVLVIYKSIVGGLTEVPKRCGDGPMSKITVDQYTERSYN